MDAHTALLLVAGLVCLALGGDFLVRGATGLSLGLRIPPLVIGLTVVAYGTSAPEAAVTVTAAYEGGGAIGLGNVVGSGLFNVLVVLGFSALIAPLTVTRQVIRREVPVMIGTSILFWLLCLDGLLTRADGILLVALMLGYTAYTVRAGRRNHKDVSGAVAGIPRGLRGWGGNAGFVGLGLGLLVLGSVWLVEGAVTLARSLGVSELVLGLTIVAAGTSLPEVAASVAASFRGQREIAVGNVIGSNIFNVLFAVGAAALLAPHPVAVPPAMVAFDLPLLVAVQVACLPIFFRFARIERWEGILFLAGYGAYLAYVILDASGHDALAGFTAVMVEFVLPFLAITLVVLAVQGWQAERRERQRR